MTLDKASIHRACLQVLDEKIASIQAALDDLRAGSESESKSTAGDKHETGRAMVQMEQARLGKQLSELLAQDQTLRSIDPNQVHKRIALGSLIHLEHGLFYLSVALGKVDVDGTPVMTLSPASPLGALLTGSSAGAVIAFNQKQFAVQSVW